MCDWIVALSIKGKVIDVLPWQQCRAKENLPSQIPDSWDEYAVYLVRARSRGGACVKARKRWRAMR